MTGGRNSFARAKAAFAAIAAAVSAFGHDLVARTAALNAIPAYRGNPKTGSRPHPRKTTRRDQRAALKKRNRQRNKLAHRRAK